MAKYMFNNTQQLASILRKIAAELRTANEHMVALGNSIQQEADAAREDRKAEKEKQNAKSSREPIAIRADVPIAVEAETRERQGGWQIIKRWVEIVGVGAAIIYTLVSYGMWQEMIQASETAQRSVNEARLARIQSVRALNTTVEQFHLDQRAWIGLVNFETVGGKQSDDSKTFSYSVVRLTFRNTGKSPALNVSVQPTITDGRAGIQISGPPEKNIRDVDELTREAERYHEQITAEMIRKNPKDADRIRRERADVSPKKINDRLYPPGSVVAPTAEHTVNIGGPSGGTLFDKNGTPITRYILGKVTYNDVFTGSKQHTTKFCLMWLWEKFVSCPTGNSMD